VAAGRLRGGTAAAVVVDMVLCDGIR